jgi:hypothetical protein
MNGADLKRADSLAVNRVALALLEKHKLARDPRLPAVLNLALQPLVLGQENPESQLVELGLDRERAEELLLEVYGGLDIVALCQQMQESLDLKELEKQGPQKAQESALLALAGNLPNELSDPM